MSSTSPAPNTAVALLRELAAALHTNNYDSLSIELTEQDIQLLKSIQSNSFELEGIRLIFSSLAERNKLAADQYFYSLKSAADEAEVFDTAYKIWIEEISSEDKASGRFLALCHSKIDVFLASKNIIAANTMRPYDVLNVIDGAIPYIENLQASSLIELYIAQFEHTRNDLAGDLISSSLQNSLQNNEALCQEILSKIRENPILGVSNLYTVAGIAWANCATDRATEALLKDVEDPSPIIVTFATWVIGRTLLDGIAKPELINPLLSVIFRKIVNSDAGVSRAAIRSAILLAPSFNEAADVVTQLLRERNPIALEGMARLLLRQSDETLSHPRLNEWLEYLAYTPAEAISAVSELNFILSRLIKNGQPDLALPILEKWIIQASPNSPKDKFVAEVMSSTFHEIMADNVIFSKILTTWLLHSEIIFPKVISSITPGISFNYINRMNFDAAIVSKLDEADLILLVRRMLGYVFFEGALIDLTLSLLCSTSNKEFIARMVQGLLSEEIGINYPTEVLERLKEYAVKNRNRTAKKIEKSVKTKLTQYLEALEQLPRLTELKPSPRMIEAFYKAQTKAMNRNREQAEEMSIFAKIATRIPLKAGTARFSYTQESYTNASPLQSHSVSITIPRQVVLDKVGHELESLYHRISQRNEE